MKRRTILKGALAGAAIAGSGATALPSKAASKGLYTGMWKFDPSEPEWLLVQHAELEVGDYYIWNVVGEDWAVCRVTATGSNWVRCTPVLDCLRGSSQWLRDRAYWHPSSARWKAREVRASVWWPVLDDLARCPCASCTQEHDIKLMFANTRV